MEDKYYYVDGKTPMTKDEFLKFYSGVYLWQNSAFVEDCVLKILRKEKSQIDVEDLIVILAWKMGKINHKQSSLENKLVFHEGWSVQEKKAKFYEHTLNIDLIFDKFKSITDDSVESYLKEFSTGDTYIGPVYALTLRYFATKGAEPIYDHFASKALWYIFGIEPKLKEPTFGNMNTIYQKYSKVIKTKFQAEYEGRDKHPNKWRAVDQALWAYGHCYHLR